MLLYGRGPRADVRYSVYFKELQFHGGAQRAGVERMIFDFEFRVQQQLMQQVKVQVTTKI